MSFKLALCIITFVPALLWVWYRRDASSFPKEFPAAGSWPMFKSFESVVRGKDILHSAYRKQLHNGKVYKLHGIFGDSLLLPPSMLPWLISQPERQFSAKWAQMDALNIPITFLRPEIGIDPIHEGLIRRNLNASLERITGEMFTESALALEEYWGDDQESWCRVDLDYTVRRVVARVANRVFVGEALCHNVSFIENSIRYINRVSLCGLLLNLFPRCLRQGLGVVFTIPIQLSYLRCSKHLAPLFSQAFKENFPQSTDHVLRACHSTPADAHAPGNFSSWLVTNSQKFSVSNPERTLEYLTRRIMAMNFAAIHTSSMTTCNLLLDIFAQPQIAAKLRSEALVSQEANMMAWSHSCLNQMFRLDSALRESLRLWGLVAKAMSRKVMQPGGIELPNGQRVPKGVTVCVSGWGLHHDEARYPRPFEFVADRFIQSSRPGVNNEDSQGVNPGRKAAARTDEQFAAWGIGKHACPGRYFAVDLIKAIVTQILLMYEVEPVITRPESAWLEYNVIPAPLAKLSVRRRRTRPIKTIRNNI